jgi:hypothetical protein
VSEQLLRVVQDLDQRVGPELLLLDEGVEQLEALVAARVRWQIGRRARTGLPLGWPRLRSGSSAKKPRGGKAAAWGREHGICVIDGGCR